MLSKKKATLVIGSFFILIFIVIGSVLLFQYREISYIDNQIAANAWDTSIVSEQTRYDSKIGEFYKEYIYDYRVRETFDSKEKYVITGIFLDNTGLDDLHMPYQFAIK
ncbi:hypothetical protein [Alkalibacterium olivapovliticus]|uniref:Uncharacterized protein n=1 Tax=Alkalibacterium olivapovliticus TaxID=99907 RepID=A0A2T0W6D4_9LACT|nr:hypothetical protein [Alkalibacterium olivapovliticus]PRY82266.1 hypothetical protein CLV38_1133 [Alkalibacterium olivapovliticus]